MVDRFGSDRAWGGRFCDWHHDFPLEIFNAVGLVNERTDHIGQIASNIKSIRKHFIVFVLDVQKVPLYFTLRRSSLILLTFEDPFFLYPPSNKTLNTVGHLPDIIKLHHYFSHNVRGVITTGNMQRKQIYWEMFQHHSGKTIVLMPIAPDKYATMGMIKKKGKGSSSFISRSQLSLFAAGCFCIGIWNIQVAFYGTDRLYDEQQHASASTPSRGRTNSNRKGNISTKVTWSESPHNTKILGTDNVNNHFDDNPDLPYNRIRIPTHTACQDTRGVYHIAIADRGGGVGTALFQLLIDQIVYAESQSLTPYMHLLPNVSEVIDDPIVFATSPNKKNITFRAYTAPNLIPYVRGQHWRDIVPGPLNETAVRQATQQQIHLSGTGIWGHYFEPISTFVPGDISCENKLYVTIGVDDMYLVIPGLHGYATTSVRCWRYDFLPDYVSQPHRSLYTWLTPQRQRAARIVRKYFHFRPYLLQRAQAMNPNCSMNSNPCLGLHIRHSDKSAGRRVLAVSEFLPYCEQFVKHGGKQLYLATDSIPVLQEIQETWPQHIVSLIQSTSDMVRSSDTTAVFDMASHHRTNQEVLVEIIALSSCQFLIHGHSAVSEAAIWMNYDVLHYTSINLEDDDHINIAQYKILLQNAMDGAISKSLWPQPLRAEDLWPPSVDGESASQQLSPTQHACDDYDGVLLITSVGRTSSTGPAFFTSILNQLLYAERYNLKPFILILMAMDVLAAC